ncbi:hypothetical protein ABHN03_03935 [Paenibacillus sp. NRS-1775]
MNDQFKLEVAIEALRQIQEYDADSFENDYFSMKEIADEAIKKISR